MKSLQETKKALVMGASSGIGAQVARILLERGWTVGVAARRQEPLQALRQEFPHAVHTRHIDVTEQDAPRELTALIEEMGGIDLYFHASGVGKQNPELDPETEMHTAATNADGFMRMVICAYRYMAAHGGGHIAVISSIAGTKGLGPAPAYSAPPISRRWSNWRARAVYPSPSPTSARGLWLHPCSTPGTATP